jgi:hypothetical protein
MHPCLLSPRPAPQPSSSAAVAVTDALLGLVDTNLLLLLVGQGSGLPRVCPLTSTRCHRSAACNAFDTFLDHACGVGDDHASVAVDACF